MQTDNVGNPKVRPSSRVITQELSIEGQLQSGTRFFDLRIYRNHKGRLHAGHFAEFLVKKGTADMGGFGPSLEDVLLQVLDFLNTPDSSRETVILKFSHIYKDARTKVIDEVIRRVGAKLYRKNNNITVGAERFQNLRGKVIAIFEKGFVGTGPRTNMVINFENKKGSKAFAPTTEKTGKLILRGEYSNKRQLGDIVKKQKKNMEGWNQVSSSPAFAGELMQLYWTSTWHIGSPLWAGSVRKNTEGIWTKRGRLELGKLILNYKPNIVLVDFANADKNDFLMNLQKEKIAKVM
jgi:hypothetical protein